MAIIKVSWSNGYTEYFGPFVDRPAAVQWAVARFSAGKPLHGKGTWQAEGLSDPTTT